MAIDPEIAEECVRQGAFFSVQPHYLLGVIQLRSAIPDGSGGQIGLFRLKQTEWDANCNSDDFEFHFTSAQITSPIRQCAVFGYMANRAFAAFVSANSRNPSAKELYLQQFPGADATGLQQALNDTAALLDPAAQAVLDDPQSVSPIANADQKVTGPLSSAPIPKLNATLTKLVAANLQRWRNMQITVGLPTIDAIAHRLTEPAAKQQYETISGITHVPWFIIAVIHQREAAQNFNANIAQGDPWNKVSVRVPAGRGPFASFQDAAVDALTNCAPFAARWGDWTPGGAMTLLEQYNGLGYALRNVPSPYIWASTDQYVRGKFIADHVFDPNVVDAQLGCAAMLARMKVADPTIAI